MPLCRGSRTSREEHINEARTVRSVARHRERTAQEIINGIHTNVQTLTLGFAQHDHVTIVVAWVG